MPVQMLVDKLLVDPSSPARCLLLREAERERYLPIAIGPAEATAIAVKMLGEEVPRPLSHDLLGNTIAVLGGRVTRVLLRDVVEEVFYATIVLDTQGRHVEVDARPSDAIALALRLDVPIVAEEAVLEQAGVVPAAPGATEAEGESRMAAPGEPVREEQLGAFRAVIDHLDLDDFGGHDKGGATAA